MIFVRNSTNSERMEDELWLDFSSQYQSSYLDLHLILFVNRKTAMLSSFGGAEGTKDKIKQAQGPPT